jgi:hypothetical protein
MEGRVLRVENGLTVMSVGRYEFRTGGRLGAPSNSDLEALKQRIAGLLVTPAATHQFV